MTIYTCNEINVIGCFEILTYTIIVMERATRPGCDSQKNALLSRPSSAQAAVPRATPILFLVVFAASIDCSVG